MEPLNSCSFMSIIHLPARPRDDFIPDTHPGTAHALHHSMLPKKLSLSFPSKQDTSPCRDTPLHGTYRWQLAGMGKRLGEPDLLRFIFASRSTVPLHNSLLCLSAARQHHKGMCWGLAAAALGAVKFYTSKWKSKELRLLRAQQVPSTHSLSAELVLFKEDFLSCWCRVRVYDKPYVRPGELYL